MAVALLYPYNKYINFEYLISWERLYAPLFNYGA